MTNVVVFNPSDAPVYVGDVLVDGGGWRYFEDNTPVLPFIDKGVLIVPVVPEEGSEMAPAAFTEYSKLYEARRPTESATPKKRKVRDTESVKDTSTNESEA